MDNLKNKKIAVIGYGVEGKSLVGFLIKNNPFKIVIFDEVKKELDEAHQNSSVNLLTAKLNQVKLEEFDIVFKSPGIKRDILNCPDEKISTATNLFFSLAKGKTIGVTGTKGKSTTSLLIKAILEQNNKHSFIGGNIGQPMLDFVDELNQASYSVIELSSFQLQDLMFFPSTAVILPIFPDHLDYHKDFAQYLSAKKRIFAAEETNIICAKSNKALLDLEGVPNKVEFFDDVLEEQVERGFARKCQIPAIDLAGAKKFADIECLNIDFTKLEASFNKLPLRIENVGQIGTTTFFNDSASTNPISTINAIDLVEGDMVIIIGGSSKDLEMTELCVKIKEESKIKSVSLFGKEGHRFQNILLEQGYDRNLTLHETLDEVFDSLDFKNYRSVLFSPAYASFDQYANYKERGEHFNRLVQKIKCQST